MLKSFDFKVQYCYDNDNKSFSVASTETEGMFRLSSDRMLDDDRYISMRYIDGRLSFFKTYSQMWTDDMDDDADEFKRAFEEAHAIWMLEKTILE